MAKKGGDGRVVDAGQEDNDSFGLFGRYFIGNDLIDVAAR
jgi:hypothetical protein